jgi:galactokinase
VESGVSRGLGDSEYNARRAQCESAAAKLNVRSLRDADWSKVEAAALNDLERKRALHVVAEIERVRQAASAIVCGDMATLAATLRDGHASLRNLFEVSVPEVDILVDRINVSLGDRGGARMTGGGFGGAIVIALERSAMPLLRDTLDRPIRIVF